MLVKLKNDITMFNNLCTYVNSKYAHILGYDLEGCNKTIIGAFDHLKTFILHKLVCFHTFSCKNVDHSDQYSALMVS